MDFVAGLSSIEVEGANALVFMAAPTSTALAALTLPTPGLTGHSGPVLIVLADLSVAGDYEVQFGTYDPAASAGTRFTEEETVAVVQSDGPTYTAWIYRTLPPDKAVRFTSPGAGSGYARTFGKLVQMTL